MKLLSSLFKKTGQTLTLSSLITLLAGFNIPVSEDGMLFISALIATKFPENFYLLFLVFTLVRILVI